MCDSGVKWFRKGSSKHKDPLARVSAAFEEQLRSHCDLSEGERGRFER